MRIIIDDNFDDKTESEYKSVDNDSIIGNGALGNDYKIVDVKDFKENNEITKESIDVEDSYNVIIQGGAFIEGSPVEESKSNKTNVKDKKNENKKNENKKNENKKNNGKITVTSRLGGINGTVISSARINLYALNGISPKLLQSKLTDENGVVEFNNLANGSYRIIAIVDRKYFEKPTYIDWNEVTINEDLTEESIIVINKIKGFSNK